MDDNIFQNNLKSAEPFCFWIVIYTGGDWMDKQLEVNENLEKGSDDFFCALYKQYYRPVVNYISGILAYRNSSEEIAQEVFIKLLKNIKSLSLQCLKGWIYTVAHHETINYIKKNSKVAPTLKEQYDEPSVGDTAFENLERVQEVPGKILLYLKCRDRYNMLALLPAGGKCLLYLILIRNIINIDSLFYFRELKLSRDFLNHTLRSSKYQYGFGFVNINRTSDFRNMTIFQK
jgi:RNA polymerase sigma factor (sigma-70 family)